MYKIKGADEREYGPVSADRLKEWIAQGRAGESTLVRREGSFDWKPLSKHSEFAKALAAKSGKPQAPEKKAPTITEDTRQAQLIFEQVRSRNRTVDIGDCVYRSWEMLRDHPGLLIGSALVIWLIVGAIEAIPVAGPVLGAVLNLVLWGGYYWMVLRLVRAEPASFADAFAGFRGHFGALALAGVVTTVGVAVGLVLLVVPGVFLAACWLMFGSLVIMDQGLGYWSALELSRKVVMRKFWDMLGLFLVSLFLLLAGVLALGVGLFVTTPLAVGMIVFAYEDIFGVVRARNDSTQQ